VYPAGGAGFGEAVLELRSGISWLPIASILTAVAATAITPSVIGTGLYMVMRDTAFHKIKVYLAETVGAFPNKTNAPTGFGGGFATLAAEYTNSGSAVDTSPYAWVRGRSDLFINSFLSQVGADNDKTRRRRGIA
jgi:hypothetical protein